MEYKITVPTHEAAMNIVRQLSNLHYVDIKFSQTTGQWTVKYKQYTHHYMQKYGRGL